MQIAGAGDLHYGEMEMRRRSPRSASQRGRTRARGDRLILHAYWLVSGYGLRPARALASLVLVLVIGAALLWWFGFHEGRSYERAAAVRDRELRQPPAIPYT